MRVAIAQFAPVFMDRAATLDRVGEWVNRAADSGAKLVCMGESLVPAYPFWLERTGGARFNDPAQKRWHAEYLRQAVCIEEGQLEPICRLAAARSLAVVLGVAERPLSRGGHSVYCSRVFIGGEGPDAGRVLSVHRKLMPTYEERLAWGIGDGSGLVTHRVGEFTVGALNCWENWMPLARAALYAAGENLHVMLWPGAARLTRDITRFVAIESRSFVVSAGALLRESDLPPGLPGRESLAHAGETIYDGGSCIAGPDGDWICEPVSGSEQLVVADLDCSRVLEERQNFDPSGHYSRPDVLSLTVRRTRQQPVTDA
jgi:nitrilase